MSGTGRGRRWGTTQLNRSLFLALVAQFQSFSRDLHDEAAQVFIGQASPRQADTLEVVLVQGRRLDTHNPRRSTLGHDFVRLGLTLIDDLKATGPATASHLDALDRVVDYRNAIGHGDETKIATIEAAGFHGQLADAVGHRDRGLCPRQSHDAVALRTGRSSHRAGAR